MAKEKKSQVVKEKKAKGIAVNWDMDKAGIARYKDDAYKMFYTKVLRGQKRLKGEVVKMAPLDYLEQWDYDGFDVTDTVRQIQLGRKISIPVLDEVHERAVGIEVVIACDQLGIREIPVLLCEKE